jgi:hypothetical protein
LELEAAEVHRTFRSDSCLSSFHQPKSVILREVVADSALSREPTNTMEPSTYFRMLAPKSETTPKNPGNRRDLTTGLN